MSRKLGKKHKNYKDRSKDLYKKGPDGVMHMRRSYNGRRVVESYGFNALVAWSWDREKYQGGEQFSLNLKMTAAKKARLDRTEELQDRVGPGRLTDKQQHEHFQRNHVTRLGRLK